MDRHFIRRFSTKVHCCQFHILQQLACKRIKRSTYYLDDKTELYVSSEGSSSGIRESLHFLVEIHKGGKYIFIYHYSKGVRQLISKGFNNGEREYVNISSSLPSTFSFP